MLGLAGLHIQQGRPPHPPLQSSRCAATGGLAPAAMGQLAASGMSAAPAGHNTPGATYCSLLVLSIHLVCALLSSPL